jgi:hypothetical protein
MGFAPDNRKSKGRKGFFGLLSFAKSQPVALLPACQLKVYEGAAHGLPITHANRLNADLLGSVVNYCDEPLSA